MSVSHCVLCGNPLPVQIQKTLDGKNSVDSCPVYTGCKVTKMAGRILFLCDNGLQIFLKMHPEEEYQNLRKIAGRKSKLPKMPPVSRFIWLDQKTFDAVLYACLPKENRNKVASLQKKISSKERIIEEIKDSLLMAESTLVQLKDELDFLLLKIPAAFSKKR